MVKEEDSTVLRPVLPVIYTNECHDSFHFVLMICVNDMC